MGALQRLERQRWTDDQAADEAALRQRIETHPGLCVGAFVERCVHQGRGALPRDPVAAPSGCRLAFGWAAHLLPMR